MNDKKETIPLPAIIQMLFFIIILPFLPLLISRRRNWWEASRPTEATMLSQAVLIAG